LKEVTKGREEEMFTKELISKERHYLSNKDGQHLLRDYSQALESAHYELCGRHF
jgi:hypothetical protein